MKFELDETDLNRVTYALRELAGRRAEQSIDWHSRNPTGAKSAGEESKTLYALSERLSDESRDYHKVQTVLTQ